MNSFKLRLAPCHGLLLYFGSLAWLALSAQPLTVLWGDEPKPAKENGVSIKLKLLPEKKSDSKQPPAAESKSEGESKEKSAKQNASAKDATETQNKKQDLDGKPSGAAKAEADAHSVAKSTVQSAKSETGSVELKLLPSAPTVEGKTEVKTTGTVSVTLQPQKSVATTIDEETTSTTVDVSLRSSKEIASGPGKRKVSIDLVSALTKVIASNGDKGAETAAQNVEVEQVADETGWDSKTVGTATEKQNQVGSTTLLEDQKESSAKSSVSIVGRGGDPGDPGDGEAQPLKPQPGDVPLEQEAAPLDVPAARATVGESRFRATTSAQPLDIGSEAERERKRRIEAVLDYFRTYPENVVRRGPWAIMHAILPYGVETEVIASKQKVNAIGWLCHNGISAKQRMFQPTQTGFRTNVGPGVQGHEGQFLAILAQSHVQSDYPIQIGKKKYTIRDLVKYEMATCREKSELTFKLIGFSHYLEPQQTWRDNRGHPWSIEKMVAEELAQPINGEACGGTHRLMGLTCAVVSRQEANLPVTGHFERAQKFLNDFVEYTLTLQNADGSFSTEWLERRAEEPNVERKVQTTGHILEWLVYTLPDEHLRKAEIEKAVDFLLNSIGDNPSRDWPIGPRGHSLRALSLYLRRAYKGQQPDTPANVASKPSDKTIQR